MHISKSRHPLKPCFVDRCPHCRRTGEFWLVQLSGQVGLFAGTGFSLACGACNFEKLLNNREAEKLSHLADRYQQFLGGQIAAPVFAQEITACRLRAITEFKREAEVWMCTKCQEENPLNFESCWHCGSTSPNPPVSNDDLPPQLPDVGGKHAWE